LKFLSSSYTQGCTSSNVVGPLTPFTIPIEVEGKSAISFLFFPKESHINIKTFLKEDEDISEYIKMTGQRSISNEELIVSSNSVSFVLAAEKTSSSVSDFISSLKKSQSNAQIFGKIFFILITECNETMAG
jgi:hypothetical protein